jgi:hypothetical protein
MRSRCAAALTALACAVAVLLVAPSSPASASASGSHLSGVIVFEKNYQDTFRSTLVWRVFRVFDDGHRTLLVSKHWRAGSGYFRDSTNACVRNRGWLPDGTYRPRLYADYGGSVIKGRAIYLGAKPCADGTLRTDLFIHTEQGAGSVQCPDQPGDQACRWEYPAVNDYRSYGCVKLSPGDLTELYHAWRRWFPLGSPDRVRVKVR